MSSDAEKEKKEKLQLEKQLRQVFLEIERLRTENEQLKYKVNERPVFDTASPTNALKYRVYCLAKILLLLRADIQSKSCLGRVQAIYYCQN